jgi:S1-C subfamily serine protease
VPTILSGSDGSADTKATYVGGTVGALNRGLRGRLDLQDSKELLFRYNKAQTLRIPYSVIKRITLGQEPGHSTASRVAMGAALGVPGLLLYRKKSTNYVTVTFVSPSGSNEVIVLDLSKEGLRIAIPILEARSGRKVIRNVSSEIDADGAPKSVATARQVASTGTGFAISTDGFFLTNSHVIHGCTEVTLRGTGSTPHEVRVWAEDPANDLALLKTAEPLASVLRFAENNQLRLGQTVIVIGYPLSDVLAHGVKVTTGAISSLAGVHDDTRMVQVTAPIQPGNSGGPVLDESGNVIGVIKNSLDTVGTAMAIGKIPENINFAIKGSIARVFLDSNNVRYGTGATDTSMATPRIAETADQSVMLVECWR